MVKHHPTRPATVAPSRRWLRALAGMAFAALIATLVFFTGPKNALGIKTASARATPPTQAAQLDRWLTAQESHFKDIRPDNAKGIVWRGAAGQRTPWSVVYLHGFTASRLETAPLAEEVARSLGANVYYTRLSGHGRSSPQAMAEATAQDWMADTLEAVQIGRAIGERVLLISCSTGSTLATWFATGPGAGQIAAHVFISPNFGPRDKRAEMINGPWGQRIALALEGETRSWAVSKPEEEQAWSTRYPTRALFPMMALVKSVRDSDLSVFQSPLLVLYSERDEAVDPQETQAAFTRIGSPLKSIEAVSYSKSLGQHVLAGAIKDPEAVIPMATTITQWAKALPHQSN